VDIPRPLRVGSRIESVAQFFGRRLEYTFEVVEMEIRSGLSGHCRISTVYGVHLA
jgi:hypothetical protein